MVNKITTPPTTSELIGTVNEIIDDKQDLLVSGTNIKTINNESLLGSGNISISGGASYTAGTGIDITSDVISVTSPTLINNGASDDDLAIGKNSSITSSQHAVAIGYGAEVSNSGTSVAIGYNAKVTGTRSIQLGPGTNPYGATFYVGINGQNYKMLDYNGKIPDDRISSNIARTSAIPTVNDATLTITQGGVSKGTFTANAGTDVTIDLDAGSTPANMVTTNTDQNITGIKTFVGEKRIKFKQSASSNKLGFTLYDNTGKEAAAFEYRPNTINSYPLMSLGQYKGSGTSYISTPIYVGFRCYDTAYNASYNLVAPLAKDARSSFSLDRNYKTFYLPLGVTDGNTTVTTGSNGVLDISSLLSGGGSYTAGTGIDITSNTISVDSTVVTTNTAQTITGTKTFEGNGWVTKIQNTDVTYNVAPSETVFTAIAFVDSNNEAMGTVDCMRATDNATIMQFNVYGANGSWGSQALQLRIDANGNCYAYAPTPAAGSNDTSIATTAFVHTEAPNLAMPNYATRIALTLPASGGTMQAPYDGYLCVVINVQAGSYLIIGSNLYQAGPVNGYIGGIYPLKKNDTTYIFYSGFLNTVECNFIPCVGAA